MSDIRDYIDRAKAAQQAHDERPGTQLSLTIGEIEEEEMWHEHVTHRIREMQNNPNHDDDPGDCTDHKGV